ncbi:sideroflexin-1 [Vespula maculifrons]|uniref:Sideroflexin-1 n=1 Tax=Vespula maculifrons TaxID=7453 RepID=A0ABD2CMA6_VESMC
MSEQTCPTWPGLGRLSGSNSGCGCQKLQQEINIPLMRITELQNGIELQNESGIEVGERRSQPSCYREFLWLRPVWIYIKTIILFYITVLSLIIMNYIEKRNILQKVKWATAPIQVIICRICLTFAIPLCCALFVQRVPISVDKLKSEVQKEVRSRDPGLQIIYYNKVF